MGKEDRDKLLSINALQEYRDLWPTLMTQLLSSVPTGDLQQLKQVKRENRKQIVVDSITSRYWPDIRSALQAPGAEYVKFMGKDVALGEVAQPQVQMMNEAASYYERFGRGRMVEGGRYGGGGDYGGGGGCFWGGGGGGGGGAPPRRGGGGWETGGAPAGEKTHPPPPAPVASLCAAT